MAPDHQAGDRAPDGPFAIRRFPAVPRRASDRRRMARDFDEEWGAFLRTECGALAGAPEAAERLKEAFRHAYYAGYTLARHVR